MADQNATNESVDLYRRVGEVATDAALRPPLAIADDYGRHPPDDPNLENANGVWGSVPPPSGFGSGSVPSDIPQRAVLAEPRSRTNDSIWLYVVVFLGAVSLVVSGGLLFFHFTRDSPSANAAKPTTSARAAVSPVQPSPSAAPSIAVTRSSAAPASTTTTPKTEAGDPKFDDARNALAKLQTGVQRCVEDHIGILPGTSKKVPGAFRMFENGKYQSPGFIWKTPVFHCTQFSLDEPQTFIIQWRSTQSSKKGRGIAWIDDDGDQSPDRSLSFSATVERRHEVTVGKIDLDDPMEPF